MYIEVTYHILHLPAHYHRITWFQITSQNIVEVVENWSKLTQNAQNGLIKITRYCWGLKHKATGVDFFYKLIKRPF